MAEKRHPPSAERLKKLRKEGKTVRAPLVAGIGGVTTCFVIIFLRQEEILVKNQMLLQYVTVVSAYNLELILLEQLKSVFWLTLCFVLPCVAIGVLLEALQVGFKVEPAVVGFNAERLNPAHGIVNLLKGVIASWSFLLRAVLGAAALVLLALWAGARMPQLFLSGSAGTFGFFSQVCAVASGCAACFAALEYALKRREFLKSHGMSDDELRRELKEQEGDPLLKGFRRAQHESLAFEQLVKRIRSSKFIVVEKV